jgi:hypothetical protein
MNYWKECIEESFEDAGIEATDQQIDTVVSWIEGARENESMATGSEFIPNPLETEIDRLKSDHAKEIERMEVREFCYKKSVADRNSVSPQDVYLDNGRVVFDRC